MQSVVAAANQMLDVGDPASLTPLSLPGNWECCSVIQSMKRSCRGVYMGRGNKKLSLDAQEEANDPGWTLFPTLLSRNMKW